MEKGNFQFAFFPQGLHKSTLCYDTNYKPINQQFKFQAAAKSQHFLQQLFYLIISSLHLSLEG